MPSFLAKAVFRITFVFTGCKLYSHFSRSLHCFCFFYRKKKPNKTKNIPFGIISISIFVWTTYSADSSYFCNFVWNISIKNDPKLEVLFLLAALHNHFKWYAYVRVYACMCVSKSTVLLCIMWQCGLSCLQYQNPLLPYRALCVYMTAAYSSEVACFCWVLFQGDYNNTYKECLLIVWLYKYSKQTVMPFK